MSKEATVYVIDASLSMKESGNLSKAQMIVSKLLNRKIWGARKGDQAGVLIVGEQTCNRVNEEQGGYENVYDIGYDLYQDEALLRMPTAKMLDRLEHLEPIGNGDMMDAIIVAIHLINEHCISQKTGKPLKYDKKLYLFTDANTDMDTEFLDAMVEKCETNQVQTTLCTFDFSLDESSEQFKRQTILEKITKATENGICVDSNEAIDMVEQMQAKAVKPTTTFRGDLTLGDPKTQGSNALSIPIWLYNQVSALKLPSAKKYSKLSHSAVGTDRLYYKETPEGEEEDFAGETIKAYKYGKYLIPITEEDELGMKLNTSKQLEIIQFVKLGDIKREWYMGTIYAMVPSPESKLAKVQFDAMLGAMYAEDVGAIVRYVRTDNSIPKLCLLKYGGQSSAYLIQLPFSSDARPIISTPNTLIPVTRKEKSLARYCTDDQVDSKMDAFIDSMTTEDFVPEELHNASYLYMTQCIAQRAMNKSAPLPSSEEFLEKLRPKSRSIYTDELRSCFRLGKEQPVEQSQDVVGVFVPPPVQPANVDLEAEEEVDVFDLFD
jgi:ATP-dependent DNA helicase 2 subunit 2